MKGAGKATCNKAEDGLVIGPISVSCSRHAIEKAHLLTLKMC